MSVAPVATSLSVLTNLGELLASLGGAESIDALARKAENAIRWSADISSLSIIVKSAGWRTFPGAHAIQLTPPQEQVVEHSAPLLLAPSDEEPGSLLVPLRTTKGTVGVVQFWGRSGAEIREADKPILRLLAIGLDGAVARVLALEGERGAKELAQEAIRRRTEMIESLTHDIRNPLGALVTMAEFLEEDVGASVPTESREDIVRIRSCAARVCALVDQLLDVPPADREPFDIVGVLSNVVTRARWPERLELVRCLPESSGVVLARQHEVERVLENLISNAIKYSPGLGQVRVEAHLSTREVTIRISDDGIGIPSTEVERVFQRGGRATNVGDIQGSGLGLADAREVVRAADGELNVIVSETKGSSFVLTMPLFEAPELQAP